MSTGGKVAIGIIVAGGAGAAFYVVWKRRQAMLAGLQAPPVSVGITSQYSSADTGGVMQISNLPLQGPWAGGATQVLGGGGLAGGLAAVGRDLVASGGLQSVPPPVSSGPALSTRTGGGHF